MEIVSGHKQASHNARCTNAPVPGETFDIQPNCESGVRGGGRGDFAGFEEAMEQLTTINVLITYNGWIPKLDDGGCNHLAVAYLIMFCSSHLGGQLLLLPRFQ